MVYEIIIPHLFDPRVNIYKDWKSYRNSAVNPSQYESMSNFAYDNFGQTLDELDNQDFISVVGHEYSYYRVCQLPTAKAVGL